jgi:predicted dehydrogenase
MTTRITLVGAGAVARRHVNVLTSLPDVSIASVADPSDAAAETLARHCDADPFRDFEEALDRAKPDAVYICVPPFAHGEPEKAVLARGLPMFVEKPLAVDMPTALDIAARVEDTGVVTGTGYHWRCLDTVAEAQELLQERAPLLACGYWLDKRPTVPWWAHADRSGGQVVEQLTHVIDLARVLLGDAVDVYAAGARHPTPAASTTDHGDVEDATAATVRFASGTVATLAATSLLDMKHKASLHTFSRGLVVELSEDGIVVSSGGERHHRRPAEDPRLTVDREFIEAVRGEREATRAPYTEIIRSHELGCAVAESARTGRPVNIPIDGSVRSCT